MKGRSWLQILTGDSHFSLTHTNEFNIFSLSEKLFVYRRYKVYSSIQLVLTADTTVLVSRFILCYVMLCYVMLCYVMLCYVMLCYVMLRYVTLCYVMLRYVTLCYVMLRYVTLCYVMLRYVTLRYVTLHYIPNQKLSINLRCFGICNFISGSKR